MEEPLYLYHSYENCLGYGLLPTPNMKPIRKAIWMRHPVIEIENVLNKARKDRKFSILSESEKCAYTPGIYLKYLIGIYGEKIARVSFCGGEFQKQNLIDEFSPRTADIYATLEWHLIQAANVVADQKRGRSKGASRC